MVSIIPRTWYSEKYSISQLESQYWNFLDAPNRQELSALDREGLFESVIQRFKHCYELMSGAVSTIIVMAMVDYAPKGARRVFRHAIREKLIECSGDWVDKEDRPNLFRGTYDDTQAAQELAFLGPFIKDAHSILDKIAGSEASFDGNGACQR